jgi:hypothetical protein
MGGFLIDTPCREDSFYVRFTDEDREELEKYADDMGYILEAEFKASDPHHPIRFKIISNVDPLRYGWVSKVIEQVDGDWRESYLYGFYKLGSFRNKYPISFNIQSRMMRGVVKREAEKNPKQRLYFKTLFGILDLEPESDTLEFILSWLSSCKFERVSLGTTDPTPKNTKSKRTTPVATIKANLFPV